MTYPFPDTVRSIHALEKEFIVLLGWGVLRKGDLLVFLDFHFLASAAPSQLVFHSSFQFYSHTIPLVFTQLTPENGAIFGSGRNDRAALSDVLGAYTGVGGGVV